MNIAPPRRKRLLVLFGVVVVIGLLKPFWGPRYDFFFNEHFNSQWKHLRQVREHIEAIRPRWNAFTNQNAGYEMVKLFPYTAEDGMFGAAWQVVSEEQLANLQKFMESTTPPRPIYLGVQVVAPETFKILRFQGQSGSSTNMGQPIRSETSRPSSAAGSRLN
jgi:hypothetical protein